MFVKELFEEQGVSCPEWLSNEFLKEEWHNSEYSFVDNTHQWILLNPLKNIITFDGEEYAFISFDIDDKTILFEKVITAEEVTIT